MESRLYECENCGENVLLSGVSCLIDKDGVIISCGECNDLLENNG